MKLEPLAPTATADIKYNIPPSQFNRKCHTKGPFTSVPTIGYIMAGF